MSRGSGSSRIAVAVFLTLLFIVLPVSADNVTTAETTVAPNLTVNATPTLTVEPTQTANATATTTVVPTQTNASPKKTKTTVTRTAVPTTTTAVPTMTANDTTGSVMVYSSPTGASILIDGIYAGITPGNVNGVPAGNHILRLTLSGYHDYEGSIYVIPGQTAQGYGTLQPISQRTSVTPAQTVVVPVIVPVITASPGPTQDPGLLGNSTVITAIIGAIAVIIGSAATIFTHVKPPKKE